MGSSDLGGQESDRACRTYEVFGRRVRVMDSWAVSCKLSELAEDPWFNAEEKTAIAMRLVLPDPQRFAEAYGEDAGKAFEEVLWQAFCMDDGSHESMVEKPLMDPRQDAARIRVTMRSAYGYGREFEQLPFRDVCEMIGMAPHETPMGQALYYRTAKPPKRTKYNREEVEQFKKARRFYRLRGVPNQRQGGGDG